MCIIIIGGGKFGMKAIEFVKEKNKTAILIDKDPQCQAKKLTDNQFKNFKDFKHELNQLKKNKIYFIEDDVTIVNKLLLSIDIDYIIPVIPVHLMASIIFTFFEQNSINLIPCIENTKSFTNAYNNNLILSSNIDKGIVYMSHAKVNEMCPDNCAGPPKYCPHFKREKTITITRYLRECFNVTHYIDVKDDDVIKIILILESYQLKPGLGGLKGFEVKEIFKILNQKLATIKDKNCEIIIATTCNCHGVINFYKKG